MTDELKPNTPTIDPPAPSADSKLFSQDELNDFLRKEKAKWQRQQRERQEKAEDPDILGSIQQMLAEQRTVFAQETEALRAQLQTLSERQYVSSYDEWAATKQLTDKQKKLLRSAVDIANPATYEKAFEEYKELFAPATPPPVAETQLPPPTRGALGQPTNERPVIAGQVTRAEVEELAKTDYKAAMKLAREAFEARVGKR